MGAASEELRRVRLRTLMAAQWCYDAETYGSRDNSLCRGGVVEYGICRKNTIFLNRNYGQKRSFCLSLCFGKNMREDFMRRTNGVLTINKQVINNNSGFRSVQCGKDVYHITSFLHGEQDLKDVLHKIAVKKIDKLN